MPPTMSRKTMKTTLESEQDHVENVTCSATPEPLSHAGCWNGDRQAQPHCVVDSCRCPYEQAGLRGRGLNDFGGCSSLVDKSQRPPPERGRTLSRNLATKGPACIVGKHVSIHRTYVRSRLVRPKDQNSRCASVMWVRRSPIRILGARKVTQISLRVGARLAGVPSSRPRWHQTSQAGLLGSGSWRVTTMGRGDS